MTERGGLRRERAKSCDGARELFALSRVRLCVNFRRPIGPRQLRWMSTPDLMSPMTSSSDTHGHASGSGLRIRYMGSKNELAQDVAKLVEEFSPERPFLDLFCGMCSVGGAIAPSKRMVWGNDVQWSAQMAAQCVLASPEDPLPLDELTRRLEPLYRVNRARLVHRFSADLKTEQELLSKPNLAAFQATQSAWKHAGNDARRAREISRLARDQREFPYRLFSLTFAWGYFGLA
jgi:hypothetical protein